MADILKARKFITKFIIFGDGETDMKAADFKFDLINSYFGLLNNLSPDRKLELISKLSDSLKGSKKPTDKSIGDLYGAFISAKSADEIINDLKSGRNFNRLTEDL